MKRIALLIAVAIAAACGGTDPAADPAEITAQATPHANRQATSDALAGHGVCQYSLATKRLTGTCLDALLFEFFQPRNPDCVGRLPLGPIVLSHRGYVDIGRRCVERL